MKPTTKLLLELCAVTTLLAPCIAVAGMPGTKTCGFDDYDSCIRFECGGDGGPYGETPCCKPPPYRPQLCKQAELYLPTTVIYAAPESVYGPQTESSFASQNHVVGNYIVFALNPMWMASFGYGYSQCGMPIPIDAGAAASAAIWANGDSLVDSTGDQNWAVDKDTGGSLWLNKDGMLDSRVPKMTRSRVDDRLWASAWTYTRRGAETNNFTALTKVSVSPYTNSCKNMSDLTAFPTSSGGTLYHQYTDTATTHDSYSTFGQFLKRYNPADFDSITDELEGITGMNMSDMSGNDIFDDSCDDKAKVWPLSSPSRPTFYLWNKYRISIHKGQVTGCS